MHTKPLEPAARSAGRLEIAIYSLAARRPLAAPGLSFGGDCKMAEDKLSIKKLQELSAHHQWLACRALKQAFSNEHGVSTAERINWTHLAEAAYHAGAVNVLYALRS